MNSVKVVKRKERAAANNPGEADQTTPPRMRPEMVVKSWINATRERRQAEMKAFLLAFRRPQNNLCLVLSD
jgi:hypothetical protein